MDVGSCYLESNFGLNRDGDAEGMELGSTGSLGVDQERR